jgi:tRNA dimethylallyltransferase
MNNKFLIVIAGPTASGKTPVAVEIALRLGAEIVNADSRQIYREMSVGTAKPTVAELNCVRHHFVSCKSIHDYYNASMYELEVNELLNELFRTSDTVVLCGGSGLYIDAVCRGIDDFPRTDPQIRERVRNYFNEAGLQGIRKMLNDRDPEYYKTVDLNNPQRILKAIEIYEMTGKPYSSFLTGNKKQREFTLVKTGLNLPRHVLHERINKRVDQMLVNGLLGEIKSLYPHRHLNALNTVGYRELFDYLDGKCTLQEASEKIKAHTRQYARRQLTWFKKDSEIEWFQPDETDKMMGFMRSRINKQL